MCVVSAKDVHKTSLSLPTTVIVFSLHPFPSAFRLLQKREESRVARSKRFRLTVRPISVVGRFLQRITRAKHNTHNTHTTKHAPQVHVHNTTTKGHAG